MTMQKTLRTYFRPDPRCLQKAQDRAAAKWPGKIIAYTDLAELFRDVRKGELAGVPFFHRFATHAAGLRDVRARLKASGVIVVEIDTGRRTDSADDYADMVDEARDFYARRNLTASEIKALAKAGGDASLVTKSRGDRLPLEHAERILNDHQAYPTLKVAIRAINGAVDAKGKKFPRRYNEAYIYRMEKPDAKGNPPKLNLKPRRSGPKVK